MHTATAHMLKALLCATLQKKEKKSINKNYVQKGPS